MAFPPVPFQEWFLRQTSTGNAALNAYVARVKADGGVVEAIGCVPLAVWDWAAPSFVGLLDLFPNAAAAYSLRKLRAAYSGSAVRVRESGGNTEADIGFTSAGELDTSALLAHCGANDGFVTVWYDQSLSNDATQTTAANQPKIVSAGSLVTENGKVAIEFDNSDDNLNTSFAIGSTTDFSAFTVVNVKDLSSLKYIWDARDGGTDGIIIFADPFVGNPAIRARLNSTTLTQYPLVSNTQYLLSTLTNSTVFIFSINGNTPLSGASSAINTTTNLAIGKASYISSGVMDGNMSELVIFKSDQSANRTAIETNINNFYSIYP